MLFGIFFFLVVLPAFLTRKYLRTIDSLLARGISPNRIIAVVKDQLLLIFAYENI